MNTLKSPASDKQKGKRNMTNEQKANATIDAAMKHVGNNESARICLKDAKNHLETGSFDFAYKRALASLKHSVGILHPDYIACEPYDVRQFPTI